MSGEHLSTEVDSRVLEALQQGAAAALQALCERAATGELDEAAFVAAAVAALAFWHRQAATWGALAGDGVPAAEALGAAEARAAAEEPFLRALYRDVTGGRYGEEREGPARLAWRLLLYALKLWASALLAWLLIRRGGRRVEVRWVVDPRALNCVTCLQEEALGWRRPEALTRLPADGSTVCRTRCRCHLEIRSV